VRSSSRRLIDKADPDVPNDLLVPLGSFQFRIPEIDRTITTERQVPQKNSRLKAVEARGASQDGLIHDYG
jgi:hypothetical protein